MSVKISFLKFISKFKNKPIELGYSVSTDDALTIPASLALRNVETAGIVGTTYKLKQIDGGFEFVGFVKSGDKNLYQLRHCFSGETFNLTKTMFDFLFEKS